MGEIIGVRQLMVQAQAAQARHWLRGAWLDTGLGGHGLGELDLVY